MPSLLVFYWEERDKGRMGMNSIARSGGPQDEGCVRTTGYGGYAFFHILCFSITTSSSLQPTVMRVLCSVDEHVLLGYWIFITVTLDYWIQEMYIAIVELKKFSGFAVLICRKNYWACMYKIYMCLSHTKKGSCSSKKHLSLRLEPSPLSSSVPSLSYAWDDELEKGVMPTWTCHR